MTRDELIAKTPDMKRAELIAIDSLIRKTCSAFEPYVAGKMLGYGEYRYRYETGREGVSCRVGLMAGAAGFSVYVSAMDEGGWLPEQLKASLGKANVGRSCIRFKRLDDLNLAGFVALLQRAQKMKAPGQIDGSPEESPSKKPAPAKKSPAKKSPTKKTPAKKSPAKKSPAKKSAPRTK